MRIKISVGEQELSVYDLDLLLVSDTRVGERLRMEGGGDLK